MHITIRYKKKIIEFSSKLTVRDEPDMSEWLNRFIYGSVLPKDDARKWYAGHTK